MRKIEGYASAILGRVIFIGFGVQIVLGIFWMCSAFARISDVGEGIVRIGQVLLAGWSGYFFLRSAGIAEIRIRLFGSLAVITFPMALQCHMGRGSWSAASSLLLAETACVIRLLREQEGDRLWRMAICLWAAAGLIRGEFLWFGAVPLVFLLMEELFHSREKQKIRFRLAVIAVAGIIIAGGGSFYQEGQRPEVCIASRFAWTSLEKTYSEWRHEWLEEIGYGVVTESSYEASGIEGIMAPALEEAVGKKKAGRLLLKLAGAAWRENTPRILKEIAWDGLGYAASPAVLPLQLKGRAYDSYSGFNYQQLLLVNPKLGKKYMDYGCWWFLVGTGIAAVLLWLGKAKKAARRSILMLFSTGVFMTVWYTMRGAGQMDYRNTVYILYLWFAGMILPAEKSMGLSGEGVDEKDK